MGKYSRKHNYYGDPLEQLITQSIEKTLLDWEWWLIGRFVTFRPKGRGFKSRSSRHVETLGKSFTRSCLRQFGVKLQHIIRAVSGAPLVSNGLEKALYK